jgi:hypothetical protein
MQRAHSSSEGGPVSEMAIVDTFTKLIFGEENDYSARELLIIQAFRAVDTNVLADTHRAMGEYLRAQGVREMIQLVSQVRMQLQLLSGLDTLNSKANLVLGASDHHQVMNRRAH